MNHVPIVRKIGDHGVLAMLDARPGCPDTQWYPTIHGREPHPKVPHGRWLRPQSLSTAFSRNQDYGSLKRDSLWIDAQYDYEGLSDYAPESGERVFGPGENLAFVSIKTTNDGHVERPDERFNLRLSVPGVWPSFGGDLWSQVTIEDDGDGGSGTSSTAEIFVERDLRSFGQVVKVAQDIAVVGAPDENLVNVYRETSGIWTLETSVVSPSSFASAPGGPGTHPQFGAALDLDHSGTSTTAGPSLRMIVGAPGIPAAYIYLRNAISHLWTLEHEISNVPNCGLSSALGVAVALGGDLAVVCAPGVETCYVLERRFDGWHAQDLLSLTSSDFDEDQIHETRVVHVARFGSSVAVSGRSILVGAPLAEYGNRGSVDTIASTDTQSVDNTYFGKGAAYVFHKTAQVMVLNLRVDTPVTAGTFVDIQIIFRYSKYS